MPASKKLKFADKEWSLERLSKLFGHNGATISLRMRKGMSLIDALHKPAVRGKLLTIDGETHTIKEWCAIIGINPSSFLRRRKLGFSLEECAAPTGYIGKITAFNKTQSLSAWSREVGIPRPTLFRRLKTGMRPEAAFRLKPPKINPPMQPITAFNRTQSIGEWSKEMGIPRATIRYRMKKMGMTAEEALLTPARNSGKTKHAND